MDNIYDIIVELCRQGKQAGWLNLYATVCEYLKETHKIDLTPEYIRGVSRRYRKRNGLNENFEPIASSRIQDICITDNKNETSILKEHGLDPKRFSVVNVRQSKWIDVSGNERTSSRLTVKPVEESVWNEDFIKSIFDKIKIDASFEKYTLKQYSDDGYILVVPIADFHYMRYSSVDCCEEGYDRETARYRYYQVINDTLSRIDNKKIRKIMYVIGNDMLNIDNLSGTTTKGTQQESEGNIESAIIEITNIIVNTIERLKKIAPVDIIYIPSNHDYLTFFGIMNAIRLKYELDENISVDYSPKERKYRLEGSCLMGFSHDLKVANVNDIFIKDASNLISQAMSRIYFVAHLHHEEAVDVGGTDVRRLPTIASQSRWEYNKGFNAQQKCQSFLIDPQHGITDIIYSYID